GMVKRMRIAHDSYVAQASEEYQRAELRSLFLGGFGQSLPELARRSPVEIDSRIPKHSPDKSGTIITAIIGPPGTVRRPETAGDPFVQRQFDLITVHRTVFDELDGRGSL